MATLSLAVTARFRKRAADLLGTTTVQPIPKADSHSGLNDQKRGEPSPNSKGDGTVVMARANIGVVSKSGSCLPAFDVKGIVLAAVTTICGRYESRYTVRVLARPCCGNGCATQCVIQFHR